jgi:signal peptidase I
MRPTVEVEDRVLVNKLAYGLRVPFSDRVAIRLRDPQPGDVVVLDSPEDGKTLLKRVVGVPGDVVRVRGGRIERNGQRASVTLSPDGRRLEILGDIEHPVRLDAGGGPDFGPVRIPTDSYLVVGDDRGRSHDGRSFGLVAGDAIRGRAVGVLLRRGAPVWHAL